MNCPKPADRLSVTHGENVLILQNGNFFCLKYFPLETYSHNLLRFYYKIGG